MAIWIYSINPRSPQAYTYGWDLSRPVTLFKRPLTGWATRCFRLAKKGDMLCVYMKNIPPNQDGIYVIGEIVHVSPEDGTLDWRVDHARSAFTVVNPVPRDVVRKFFGRGYGSGMRRMPAEKEGHWLRYLGRAEVVGGVPLLKPVKRPGKPQAARGDPEIIRAHGIKGEKHVLGLMRRRYPEKEGYRVLHAAKTEPNADHDIAVWKGNTPIALVEVKTRVGVPGDPVSISERQVACRKANRRVHKLFIVYLNDDASRRCVLEIGHRDAFRLMPREFWLTPSLS